MSVLPGTRLYQWPEAHSGPAQLASGSTQGNSGTWEELRTKMHRDKEYTWVLNAWFWGRPEIVECWGLGGPGGPQNHLKKWGASPPTFWNGVGGRRGRPNPKNRRVPDGPKTMYSMLRNSASGPEIGLPGRLLAGLLPGNHQNRPSGEPIVVASR